MSCFAAGQMHIYKQAASLRDQPRLFKPARNRLIAFIPADYDQIDIRAVVHNPERR